MNFSRLARAARLAAAFMIAAAVLAGVPATASAQQSGIPAARVLFLDLENVFRQSAVGRDIRGQLEVMLGDVQKRSEQAETGFEKRQADIFANSKGKSPDALKGEWDSLQKQRNAAMMGFQRETQAIQYGSQLARRKVNGILNEIMQEIINERGANMILDVSAVHVGGVDYDITGEVISRLDKRMPSLKVEKTTPPENPAR